VSVFHSSQNINATCINDANEWLLTVQVHHHARIRAHLKYVDRQARLEPHKQTLTAFVSYAFAI
jgi:hypothetical protein